MLTLLNYVTSDMANDYFSTRLHSDKWDEAVETDRNKALRQAEYLVSGAFSFYDAAYDDETTWNVRIVGAVCEEALHLLKTDPTTTPELLYLGINQASAGSASTSFDKTYVAPLICEATKALIGELGVLVDLDSSNRIRLTTMPL